MSQVIELVPNFSEGVNEDIISGLVRLAQSTPGASLLDYSADSNHNRTVLSLVGGPESIKEVAFDLIKYAKDHIDLTQHKGAHPRMGATDVCPLIPLKDTSIEECVDLAQEIAKRVGEELDIPIFLYEAAATAPHRKNIAKIRKGEFEGMADKIKKDKWQPDYGPDQVHPTAGATAIGARMPLVAFNVNLDTDNIDLANRIAKIVRGSSGGFKYCKAIGVMLEDRQVAQVSMNMVNYKKTPLYRVLETIRFEAKRYGVGILGTEIVGLTPAEALIDSANYYLQTEDFNPDHQVIENQLLNDL